MRATVEGLSPFAFLSRCGAARAAASSRLPHDLAPGSPDAMMKRRRRESGGGNERAEVDMEQGDVSA